MPTCLASLNARTSPCGILRSSSAYWEFCNRQASVGFSLGHSTNSHVSRADALQLTRRLFADKLYPQLVLVKSITGASDMRSLVVVSHPNQASLTHSVAQAIVAEMEGRRHIVDLVDLHQEGFDPVFSMTDIGVHLKEHPPSSDIVSEQKRIEGAEALILVFPVYWWSLPAMLKGWIDRVFVNGWAYDDSSGSRLVKKLRWLPVHLVALAGADIRTYARHGYFGAMKTQIHHGIFDYCGAEVKSSELLAGNDPAAYLETARKLAARIAR